MKPILVLGGGIAGMTTAIEAAEAGCDVILAEKAPWLGGRVARMHHYFPKLCPPACGLEINYRRIRENSRVTVLTEAELESLSGGAGNYHVTFRIAPRFVSDACTVCGDCVKVCPATRSDEFNYGLGKTKAIYIETDMAFPARYAIDRAACLPDCHACVDACTARAIHLDRNSEIKTFEVAAVVAATGWKPYDATRLDHLGFGKYPNVITNVIMERLAAPAGPTAGKIARPSDNTAPQSVAFVQCAGSRDENHLPYCSSVCCAASLKQATYVRAQLPEAKITIFYIDIRTPGRTEDFYSKVAAEANIRLVKGKVAKVEEDGRSGDLLLTFEDVMAGRKSVERANLAVLATGMVPQTDGLPPGFPLDEFQFIAPGQKGLCGAGCAVRPEEVSGTVRNATAAALSALQEVRRG